MLIVISGLPATGKTTFAAALAQHTSAVHLSVDAVEDALLRAGQDPGWITGVAAYEAVGAAAQQNLALGHVVVVDAVNDSEAARQTWRDAAGRAGSGSASSCCCRPRPGSTSDGSARGVGAWGRFPSRRGHRSSLGPRRTRHGTTRRSSCLATSRSISWSVG